MGGSPYASSLGRLEVHFPQFLTGDQILTLAQTRDLDEVAKRLEGTVYGPEIVRAAASLSGANLLEVAINRNFVRRNRLALDAAPFAGKPVISAYLRRWDIQNIELILSAKAEGRPVTETETFLVSSRDQPAGLVAGPMTLDDFRLLLQQPSLEAIAQALVRFGYGGPLLPLMEIYGQTHDIFPLMAALDRDYYDRLLRSVRFFQGDEGVVRRFLRNEIDVRNVLLLLKAKDSEVPVDLLQDRFIDGGTLTRAQVPDLYGARSVPELAQQLAGRFPAVAEGTELYVKQKSLTGYETALHRERAVTEVKRMRAFPLSLVVLFTYLYLLELERSDLRRLIYGTLYGVPADEVDAALVVPKLVP